ncbi:uncharacterized protein LOC135487787 [Lineus longissimus]|uniref:uncharacterized protein LOC135487787 n=1 Tax=Lineus longissimus TaxID=88925 RepID=UPI00315D89FC
MSAPVGQAKIDHRGEVYRRTRCRSDVLSDYDFSTINDLDMEWFSVAGSNSHHGDNGVNRGFIGDSQDGPDLTTVGLSDFDEDIALLKEDAVFQRRVSRKMKVYLINRQEAEVETLLDHIVQNQGGLDEALLYVISSMYNEIKVQTLTRILLNRGASPLALDSDRKTPLHHSVQRGFYGVCVRLLESEVDPLAPDKDGLTPFDWALKDKNDAVAALILQYVPAKTVLSKFSAPDQSGKAAEYSFHNLIKESMHKTAVAVLDCTLEPCSTTGCFRVHYHIQEADEKGRAPSHPDYKKERKSSFQLISETDKAELGLHDAVRLLVRRKWKLYARIRFQFNAIIFLFSTFSLTYAAVLASLVENPCVYETPFQISRAVAECIVVIMAVYAFVLELVQMKRNGLDYWLDRYNWQDLSSTILVLTVIPLRFYQVNAQWTVFSLGYLMWTMRIFKYAPIFSQTGVYAQTLWHVVFHDFPQFIVLFMVILLAFSGSFLLALKGEGHMGKHEETDSFWHILYTGTRTFIEGEKVVEYTGDDKYGTLGSILMVCFLLTVNILLLNILIAQLSDAYQNVQNEAKRALILNRACIVTRVEINSMFTGKGFRSRFYKEVEEIDNLTKALSKWDTNGSDKNSTSNGITDQMEMQEQSLFTIKNRLIRQEQRVVNQSRQLDKMQMDLKRLLELTLRGTTSPDFFKSATLDSRIGKTYQEKQSASHSQFSFSSGDLLKNGSLHSSDILAPNNGAAIIRREFLGGFHRRDADCDEKGLHDSATYSANLNPSNGVHFGEDQLLGSTSQKGGDEGIGLWKDIDMHLFDPLGEGGQEAIEGETANLRDCFKGKMTAAEGGKTVDDTGLELNKADVNAGPKQNDEADVSPNLATPADLGAELEEVVAGMGVPLPEVTLIDVGVGIHEQMEEQLKVDEVPLRADGGTTEVQDDLMQGMKETTKVEELVEVWVNGAGRASEEKVGGEGITSEKKEEVEDAATAEKKDNKDEKMETEESVQAMAKTFEGGNLLRDEADADVHPNMDRAGLIKALADGDEPGLFGAVVNMAKIGLVGAVADVKTDTDEHGFVEGEVDVHADTSMDRLADAATEVQIHVDENLLDEAVADVSVNKNETELVTADSANIDSDEAALVDEDEEDPVGVDEVALEMDLIDEPVVYADTAQLLAEQKIDSERHGYANQAADDLEPS